MSEGFSPNQLIRRKQGYVPDGVYTVLIHSIQQSQSKAGNAMLVLDCEVMAPETVAHVNNRNEVVVFATAHTKFRAWWTFALNDFLADNVDRVVAMGVQLAAEYPPEVGAHGMIRDIMDQLPKLLERKYIEVALTTREQYATRPLTQDEAAEGKTEGEQIIDPVTRQPKVLRTNINMNLEGIISGPLDANNVKF